MTTCLQWCTVVERLEKREWIHRSCTNSHILTLIILAIRIANIVWDAPVNVHTRQPIRIITHSGRLMNNSLRKSDLWSVNVELSCKTKFPFDFHPIIFSSHSTLLPSTDSTSLSKRLRLTTQTYFMTTTTSSLLESCGHTHRFFTFFHIFFNVAYGFYLLFSDHCLIFAIFFRHQWIMCAFFTHTTILQYIDMISILNCCQTMSDDNGRAI